MAATELLSVRVGRDTAERLEQRSETREKSSLAKRYIEEGLRMDQHPGIVFRAGPAGRRPALEGGPDVWEVIRVVKNTPESGEASVRAAAEWMSLPPRKVETAVAYYADHRDEVDDWIERVDREAAQAEAAWHRRQDALA
jgi:hypothetical protein